MPSTDVFIKWKSYLLITDIWTPDSYVSRLLKNKRLKRGQLAAGTAKLASDPVTLWVHFLLLGMKPWRNQSPLNLRGSEAQPLTDPSERVKSVFISVLKTMVAERHTTCEKQVGKSEQISWV